MLCHAQRCASRRHAVQVRAVPNQRTGSTPPLRHILPSTRSAAHKVTAPPPATHPCRWRCAAGRPTPAAAATATCSDTHATCGAAQGWGGRFGEGAGAAQRRRGLHPAGCPCTPRRASTRTHRPRERLLRRCPPPPPQHAARLSDCLSVSHPVIASNLCGCCIAKLCSDKFIGLRLHMEGGCRGGISGPAGSGGRPAGAARTGPAAAVAADTCGQYAG